MEEGPAVAQDYLEWMTVLFSFLWLFWMISYGVRAQYMTFILDYVIFLEYVKNNVLLI